MRRLGRAGPREGAISQSGVKRADTESPRVLEYVQPFIVAVMHRSLFVLVDGG